MKEYESQYEDFMKLFIENQQNPSQKVNAFYAWIKFNKLDRNRKKSILKNTESLNEWLLTIYNKLENPFTDKLNNKINSLENVTETTKEMIKFKAYEKFDDYKNSNRLENIINNNATFNKFFTEIENQVNLTNNNFKTQFMQEMQKGGYSEEEIHSSFQKATKEFTKMPRDNKLLLLAPDKPPLIKAWYRLIQPFNKHPLTIEGFVKKYIPKKSLLQKISQALNKLFAQDGGQDSPNLARRESTISENHNYQALQNKAGKYDSHVNKKPAEMYEEQTTVLGFVQKNKTSNHHQRIFKKHQNKKFTHSIN